MWRTYAVPDSDDAPHHKIREFPGHEAGTSAVAFDRTGKWLATGGKADERICVWDAVTGERRHELFAHIGSIFSLRGP